MIVPKNILIICLVALVSFCAYSQSVNQRSSDFKLQDRNITLQEGKYKRESIGIAEAVNASSKLKSSVSELPDSVVSNLLFPNEAISKTVITILLSFDESYTYSKLKPYIINEGDQLHSKPLVLRETAAQALDFWEGFIAALRLNAPLIEFDLQVIDIGSNDSLLREKLKDPDLFKSNIIIGPNRLAAAKSVAEFCKKHKILNIQPFISSMNLGTDNPYLVRLAPTIEGHMNKMYATILDSFSDAKIIIHSSKRERDLIPAMIMDSLFNDYNKTAKIKIQKVFINGGDEAKSAAYKDINTHIDPRRQNVIIYISYEPSAVNQFLRGINKYDNVSVFGMPTWRDDEIIRADYLNSSRLYFTDFFSVDSADEQYEKFIELYQNNYYHFPSVSSYLGFDVANYLSYSLKLHGYNFAALSGNAFFKGLGYNFSLSKYYSKQQINGSKRVQYFTNESVHQFRVVDYKIEIVD
jgi:ABC-type branched-subunit amino acid transport system substrate-binding protein